VIQLNKGTITNDVPVIQPSLIPNCISRCQILLSVSIFLWLGLSKHYLNLDPRVNFIKAYCMLLSSQVFYSTLIFYEVKIQMQVAVTIGMKRANASGLKLMIISSKFTYWKSKRPIVLLIEHISTKILFQNGLDSFYLAFNFCMKSCRQSQLYH
jgi:hypothetical protein